ncbi:trithorax group protein osa isoform X1 [Anastrepha obliqua]|uniref:trithorax group protein osa isoform X1 n=1 Tax=Anastrepha obliqua TaxID=95512 RepID=UPI00240A7686|nr:trithorax group protein osa isoform X1 [Anastrepha obliqua]
MMILRITALTLLLAACLSDGVVVKTHRDGFDTYGPPPPSRPAPQYGPPPQRQPHREYGVPQQIPFREYGPPALKYGPPKFISVGGGSGSNSFSSSSSNSFSNGFHEQIKSHFGVPKPFYGPPHIQHKPASNYGPPQAQYGPPPRPAPQYGPPPPKPAPQYGPPPRPSYGPPPQSLPSTLPAPLFKPEHSPASSYGPPPSGPLNLPPKPVYGPPKPSYGPPSGPGPANFNKVPETTIILANTLGGGSSGGHHHGGGGIINGGHGGGPVKQVQIQIDASGHTHSVSGSQAPFHTACDGWKPIPAPVGTYVEGNNIETQSGYSHVAQGSFGTQYSGGASLSGGSAGNFGGAVGATGSGGSIVDGLTDEQLVAVALQSGGFDTHIRGPDQPPSGPASNFKQQNINSIETDALQISLGVGDDSYSKPPLDSYAPGSIHAQKHNNINGNGALVPPLDSYGPPPSGNYLPPPRGNYGPPPPPPPPSDNYGPPPPPPSGDLFIQEQHASSSSSSSSSAQAGLQYGSQSGNVLNVPTHGASQPSRPVSFRPPVPPGLLESIGATVQHLDQFGVKPPAQPPTYIPPAANEIAEHGPGNLGPNFGPPPPPPQLNVPIGVIEQQLPQLQPPQGFAQVNQQNQHHAQNIQHFHHHQQQQQQQHQIQQQSQFQQQQGSLQQFPPLLPPPPQSQFQFLPPLQELHGNSLNQYGPPLPPPPPQKQYLPPPPQHERPLPPPPSLQYLPPAQTGPVTFQQQNSATSSSSFENSYASSQHNEQFIHAQALPSLQEPRFTQVHDCGQGPNLVGASYQLQQQNQYQQQQQHSQQYSASNSVASTSANAYNAISQSIPVAEQHTQFLEQDSYGVPPAGNNLDQDYDGYASQKSAVATLPDGTDPHDLPGLDGLNVISAQKSQSFRLSPEDVTGAAHAQHEPIFELDIAGNGAKSIQTEQTANHEEILSEGLLQSILTAIEKPQSNNVQHRHSVQVVSDQHNEFYGHGAQSRSDTAIHEDATPDDENEPEVAESDKVEVQVNADGEEVATVKEIKPIVAAEVEEDEAKH